jgi:hypothetical protein
MGWQEKASQRIREILPAKAAEILIHRIGSVRPLKGSDSKFKRFAGATTPDEIFDIHAEITYALIFMGAGFNAEFEPLGDEGPDLMVSRDGQSAYVEVKRFRNTGAPRANVCDPDGIPIFQQYGNPMKDIAKIRAELMNKFRQVRDGNGIVAFWSDNEDLEDLEFAFAVSDVREDVDNQVHTVPEGFLFSVFASDWMAVRQHQQIYCRSVVPLREPYSAWVDDLECSFVND